MTDTPPRDRILRRVAFLLLAVFVGTVGMESVIEVEGVGRISRIVGFASAASWLVVVVTALEFRRPLTFHLLVALFVGWQVMSYFWTVDPARTFDRISTYLQLLVMVVVVWELTQTEEHLETLYQAYVLGAYVSALSTVTGFVGGEAYYSGRYAAVGFHPNGLGIILVMGIPMAWYLATQAATRENHLLRWVNLAYIPASLTAIALTGTRTAVVAAVPVGIYALLSMPNLRLPVQIGLGAAIFAALASLYTLVPPESFQRLATLGTELAEGDLNGRRQLWWAAWGYFKAHPLQGVGSGAFVSLEGRVAHNAFISIGAETGAVGLLLFVAILMAILWEVLQLPRLQALFLLSLLGVWTAGAMALTWEQKKTTWLIMSFVVVAAHAKSRTRSPVHRAPAAPVPEPYAAGVMSESRGGWRGDKPIRTGPLGTRS